MSEALKLENQLCHRFYTVSNAMTRAYRPLLRGLDVTYPQYLVMMALWEEQGVTILNLIEKTRIDGGALSLILKKLQAKNLVTVNVGEQDKRTRYIHLTAAGVAAKQQAECIPEQMLCKVSALNEQELAQLISLIDKLSAGLKNAPSNSVEQNHLNNDHRSGANGSSDGSRDSVSCALSEKHQSSNK